MEKEMATHSSILAWRIPWMEELGGLQSMGHKESDMTEQLNWTDPVSNYNDNLPGALHFLKCFKYMFAATNHQAKDSLRLEL